MNDERFERSLRSTLATDAPAAAPASLHQAIQALDDDAVRLAHGGVRTRLFRGASLSALVAGVTLVAVVALAGSRGGADTSAGGLGAAPSVQWSTPFASLQASALWIETGGQRFTGSSVVDVHSDPGTATYRTLEMSWMEHGVEMRLFIYFAADSADWWVTEMRTYDGRSPGNWAYYDGPLFRTPIGRTFRGNVDLVSDRTDTIPGHLHVDGLVLSSFGLMANASQGGAASLAPVGGPVSTTASAASGEAVLESPGRGAGAPAASPTGQTGSVPTGSAPSGSAPTGSVPTAGSPLPSPDPADVAAVRDLVTTFERDREASSWRPAWGLLSPWQQKELSYTDAASAWRSYVAGGGGSFVITQITKDWTVLNYAYVGALEADLRAHADATRALAVWVGHPGINALSAGSEGLLVAPMTDGSGWRIWLVH